MDASDGLVSVSKRRQNRSIQPILIVYLNVSYRVDSPEATAEHTTGLAAFPMVKAVAFNAQGDVFATRSWRREYLRI